MNYLRRTQHSGRPRGLRNSVIAAATAVLLAAIAVPFAVRANADSVDLDIQVSVRSGVPEVGSADATVASGEQFHLVYKYTCLSSSSPCRNVQIVAPMPPELIIGQVSVPSDTVLYSFDTSRPYPPTEPAVRQHDASGTARFTMTDPLAAGSTGEIVVSAQFPDFYSPSGTAAAVQATIRGSNATQTVTSGVATVHATANWAGLVSPRVASGGAIDSDTTVNIGLCGSYPPSATTNRLAITENTARVNLPFGAQFVSASPTGSEVSPGIVQVDFTNDVLNFCENGSLVIRFPSPTFTVGQTVHLPIDWTGKPYGAIGAIAIASRTLDVPITAPVAAGGFFLAVSTPRTDGTGGGKAAVGDAVSWTFSSSNASGTADWAPFTIDTPIPAPIRVNDILVNAPVGSPFSVTIKIASRDDPTLRLAYLGPGATVNPYDSALPSGLPGLAPGDLISRLVMQVDNVPIGATAPTLTINGIVINPDRNGQPVAVNDIITLTPHFQANTSAGPLDVFGTPETTASFTIDAATMVPSSLSITSVGGFDPVTNQISYTLEANASGQTVGEPQMTLLLPLGVSLAGWQASLPDRLPYPALDRRPNFVAGRERLLWTFPVGSVLRSGESIQLTIAAAVSPTTGGNTTAEATATGSAPINCAPFNQTTADPLDLDLDLDLTEARCQSLAVVSVANGASAGAEALVQGSLDPAFSAGPAVGQTVVQASDVLRIKVSNTSTVGLASVVAVDMLPRSNDIDVLGPNQRNGTISPVLLRGAVSPVGTATVSYSTVARPCRPEVGYSPPGCASAAWSTVLASPSSLVTAVKVEFDGILQAGQSFTADLPVTLPANALPGVAAYNSFAFAANRADNASALLPSEAQKVGLSVHAGDLVIGDRVFDDRNANGVDDADPGLPGVALALYGPGPNGTLGDTDDVRLSTAVTDADGRYSFPYRGPGKYRVVLDRKTLPGRFATYDYDGGLDDAANVTLTVDSNLGVDFGYAGRAIGDYVWLDANKNGQQDVGESGVDGVTLLLVQDGLIVSSTVSGDNPLTPEIEHGFYRFPELAPDRIKLRTFM